jgi:hypothetical protein
MAYPTISAPYGLKPINLIGGQVFAGSTRNIAIQYGCNTSIFYGDVVGISRGFITRSIVTTGATAITGSAGNGTVGVFLGCSYTNPITKQKQFSQYWPAGTQAGDAVAIVTDDPDTLFKVVAVTAAAGTVVGSVARGMVGLNVTGSNLPAGSTATGNSSNGIVPSVAVENTSSLPFRIIDVVPDTAIVSNASLTSGGGTTSLVVGNLTSTLPIGTEVGYLAANGQYVGVGSWVSAAVTGTGTQTISINSAPVTVNSPTGTASTGLTIPNASTLVFTQYPEAVVKFNFGIHEYYNNTAQASTL